MKRVTKLVRRLPDMVACTVVALIVGAIMYGITEIIEPIYLERMRR